MKDDFVKKINSYTLAFMDKTEEKDYERYLIIKSINWFRFALSSGIFFYLIYSIVDFIAYPDIANKILMTRITLMLPVGIIILLIKDHEWYIKKASLLNIISICLASFGVLLITYIGRHEALIGQNFVGVIMSFIYLYNFLRIPFIKCLFLGGGLLTAAIFMEIMVVKAPFEMLMSNIFFLVTANCICLFTCYLLEYQSAQKRSLLLSFRDHHDSILLYTLNAPV